MKVTTEQWTKYSAVFFPFLVCTSFSSANYIYANFLGCKFSSCFLYTIQFQLMFSMLQYISVGSAAMQLHNVNVTIMASLNILFVHCVVGSHSNHAMGSHCLWPSGSCSCTCCFFGIVSCALNSFWAFHVASWYDIWIWHWIRHYYGWNYHRHDSAIFDWVTLP